MAVFDLLDLVPGLQENLHEETEIEEDIEKHDTLNPKLFVDGALKPEVTKKVLEVVDTFVDDLAEDGITIIVKDIVLLGSNANYNYTKDSDIDIHIIADTARLANDLFPVLYSLYRSKFNKKYEIEFYGIPVELYVESNELQVNSNGIYSVLNNKWIKEPVQQNIPDLDQEDFNNEFEKLDSQFKAFADRYDAGTVSDEDAEEFIAAVYKYRQDGLKAQDGEWSLGNLLFKEFRNRGYLDNLKDMKDKLVAKRLSLEEAVISESELIQTKLARAAQDRPFVHYNEGTFEFYLVRESDVDILVNRVRQLDFVVDVSASPSGKYDFSHTSRFGQPERYFTVRGTFKK